jgi:hypothetical protein
LELEDNPYTGLNRKNTHAKTIQLTFMHASSFYTCTTKVSFVFSRERNYLCLCNRTYSLRPTLFAPLRLKKSHNEGFPWQLQNSTERLLFPAFSQTGTQKMLEHSHPHTWRQKKKGKKISTAGGSIYRCFLLLMPGPLFKGSLVISQLS